MSGLRDSLDRVGYRLLSSELAECARDAVTGELRVSGRPGGTFHLRRGAVVAVESPGAPGPEALLLRSGRINGAQWAELLGEAGTRRWPEAELIAHGYTGAAQLRVVCVMAMQDAAFAVVAGRMEGCERLTGCEPFGPVVAGEAPARLLRDAARKLSAVASLPCPVRPEVERPVPAPGADRRDLQLSPLGGELIAHADGRRTARDIAFLTGRGVYTVTVEMARLLHEGLLECAAEEPPTAPLVVRGPVNGLVRRVRPRGTEPGSSVAGSAGAVPAGSAATGGTAAGTAETGTAETGTAGECPAASRPASVVRHVDRASRLPPAVFSALASAVAADASGIRADSEPAPAPGSPRAFDGPRPPCPVEGPAPALPRREPGASGITETLVPEKSGTSWKGFFRFRERKATSDSSG
ncbi:MarR family transcriptional regulator [Streptomyces sp. NBC_01136]|uniref:MarR family transcriptional regulator n=1 Tax=unclassified Streptomyces TaxID=2593676 RepID=UPI00324C7EEB|nr:MarR family transcriptional regulator [Streptomyces sp. NBC_01136]